MSIDNPIEVEKINGVDIKQTIQEYLDYGLDHGGWNSLLSLENLEQNIFVIDAAWQEAKGKLASDEDIQKK